MKTAVLVRFLIVFCVPLLVRGKLSSDEINFFIKKPEALVA